MRGGAFKPRTSPYDFQGLGARGLKFLAEARERTGLPVVTEVLSWEEVPVVAKYAEGDSDFSAQLTAIRADMPDVLFVPGYYTDAGLIARQARGIGVTSVLATGCSSTPSLACGCSRPSTSWPTATRR